jgi:hypothetical protein
MPFKCKNIRNSLVGDVTKYRVCFWKMKSEHWKTKGLVNVYYRKFPEFNSDKEKLEIKTLLSRNSPERINQKLMCNNNGDLDPAFFKTSTFILARGLYFTTLGVKSVNRQTNLYFALKWHVHCVYVCVCKITCYSVCGAYIPDNNFKIILCSMIRI